MTELERQAEQLERERLENEVLKNYQGEDRIVSSIELKENIEKRPKSGFKLNTQFASLDSYFEGFREGNMIVLSGGTGDGKTEFGIDLASKFSANGEKVVWFNFEVGQEELLMRFQRRQTNIPLFYLPNDIKNSFRWFKEKIKEAILKYEAKVVFIDHLHFLAGMSEQSNNISQNFSVYLGMITQELKNIAIANNLVIFLIVHPTKSDETQTLNLNGVGRDSSFIVQNADAVITIWRERKKMNQGFEYSGNVFLNVLKNRWKGQLGKIKLVFKDWVYYEQSNENNC